MKVIIVIAIIIIVLWVLSKQDKKPKSKNKFQPSHTQNVSIPKKIQYKNNYQPSHTQNVSIPIKIKYKNNWENYKVIVNQNNITCLYHFTDWENISSIRRHGGLYSWYTCEQKGIEIPMPGGNQLSKDLDLSHNLHDYVRLSFNKNQPMLYVAQRERRIPDPVFLEISPEVIYWEETLFSDENANANSAIIGGELDDFKKINFLFAKTGRWQNEQEKKLIQAEVLVKSYIPLSFIINI